MQDLTEYDQNAALHQMSFLMFSIIIGTRPPFCRYE